MLNKTVFSVLTRRRLFSTQLLQSSNAADLTFIENLYLAEKPEPKEMALMTIEEDSAADIAWDLKGRNSKTPKKSNHGARPCSSVMRKLKKQGWYKKITSY
jgi:hypothetical protein